MELNFAEDDRKRVFNCAKCPVGVQQGRKCGDDGFLNLEKPMPVTPGGLEFTFCPGKATWYEEIAELFMLCKMSYYTGILPTPGAFEDQPELFVEVFPYFVSRYSELKYNYVRREITEFVGTVLKSFTGG